MLHFADVDEEVGGANWLHIGASVVLAPPDLEL